MTKKTRFNIFTVCLTYFGILEEDRYLYGKKTTDLKEIFRQFGHRKKETNRLKKSRIYVDCIQIEKEAAN